MLDVMAERTDLPSTERSGPDAAGAASGPKTHRHEPHGRALAGRLNWLRAGVLGANDGIISTAGLVIGVAAATTDTSEIATAGVAGLVAGAVSMALGEYVSVSTQRDTERALIEKERRELATMPDAELAELIELLRGRGLTHDVATTVAHQLTAKDALRTHLSLELGIDEHAIVSPWAAAGSSALAFSLGAALPLVAILVPPASVRIVIAFVAVLLGLALTGWVSARLGSASKRAAVLRLVFGGAVAMAVTFGIGQLLGTTVG
jgi:VIT1/CCC1 family predicted Fe2+/Mn2+ transporter